MIFALLASLALQDPDLAAVDCSQAMTTIEVNECIGRDLELEQERMNLYLDTAFAVLREEAVGAGEGPDEANALIAEIQAGQTLWQAYADKACAAVYTRWQSGTIRVAMALDCQIELTRQRTHHLWSEYLSFEDSTPPILPEPALSVAAEQDRAMAD